MKLKKNIIIPGIKKGVIITITPRKVVDQDNNQVIDIPSSNTKPLGEVAYSCDSSSGYQESDTQSRSDKLHSIKQELKNRLSHLLPQQATTDHKLEEQEHKTFHKWIRSRISPLKAFSKWMIIVLNVIIELIQAIYTQDESSRQLNKANCGKLSVIMSSACLIISIADITLEAIEGEVRWRKRGMCPWFYYPGKHGRPFGSFWAIFGLISSAVQFGLSLVGYVTHGSASLRFDYMPLLLAVCFFVAAAALGGGRKIMWVVVKCDVRHGEYEIEGRFVRGRWCFACPSCETAIRSV